MTSDLTSGSDSYWALVERAARDRGSEVILSDEHGRSLTAAAFRDQAEGVAAALWERGIRPGDTVSWQLPTSLEVPVLMAACARLGVVQNPIIPVLRHREVEIIVRQIRPRLLVTPEVWRGFDHAAMGRSLGVDVLALDFEQSVSTEDGDGLRLPSSDPDVLPAPPLTDTGACRWIYYSSGTTADPKGVRHRDRSVIASANGVVDGLGLTTGDVYPIAWPLAHIGGVAMVSAVLRSGGTLVLFGAFDPSTTPVRMAEHRPTFLGSATPFFLAYIAAQRAHGSESLYPDLRVCVGGGAPTPPEIDREVAEVLGIQGVSGSWGLTEFPVATSEVPGDDGLGTTVGRPVVGVEVRVVDDELRLRGANCFLGYVDSALDEAAFDGEGWFRTGDLGSIDGQGRVRIEGRLKDVIIRNAENVSAREVEETLIRHVDIVDVAVVGIPDARTGERVCAVIQVREGADPTVADLAAHCRAEGLASYKIPETISVVALLPRNAMGKILKADLRSDLAANNELPTNRQ